MLPAAILVSVVGIDTSIDNTISFHSLSKLAAAWYYIYLEDQFISWLQSVKVVGTTILQYLSKSKGAASLEYEIFTKRLSHITK